MSKWYPASNFTAADPNSLQAVPNPGDYTDLVDGDKALVLEHDELHILEYSTSSTAAQDVPDVVIPDGNVSGSGRWIIKEFHTASRNGFVDITETTIGFDDGTRTFTITDVGAGWSYFADGEKFNISGNKTVVITDTEGLWYIYMDDDETLIATQTFVNTIITSEALVAIIYWDATNNTAIHIGDERHGADMPSVTHLYLHEVFGSKFISGLGLADFTIDASGDLDPHAQFSVADGEITDEDLRHTITDDSPQDIAPIANIPVYYRDGASGLWRKTAANTFPVKPFSGGAGRLAWNELTGGAWQQTEATNNDFVLSHIFATNDTVNPVICIQGQDEYNTLGQARNGAQVELLNLALGGLPSVEWVPIASVIFQTSTGYANAVKARTRTTDSGDNYIDWRASSITGGGGSVSDHNSLGGLQGGTAGEYYHLTSAHHTGLTGGGDTTLHDHDGIAENTVHRSSDGKDHSDVVLNNTHRTGDGSDHADVAANTALAHTQNTDTKIEQGNTKWEITDAGAGVATATVDGNSEMDITDAGVRLGGANSRVNAILDEDDMASDSATAVATQQSIKAYVRDNAGDPALPKIDFYQDWLQQTKYLNSTVVTMVDSTTLVNVGTTNMDFNIEEKRWDFTVGEIFQSTDLYDSDLSITVEEAMMHVKYTDSGTPTIQISADNGANWETVTDFTDIITFSNTGTQVLVKFTAGGTGYIEHIGIIYNPSDVYLFDNPRAWVSKTASFSAQVQNRYLVDTSSAAVTVTLPASPSAGDEIDIVDSAVNFGTNNCTLDANGGNINGSALDYILNVDKADVRLVYVDASTGWRVIDG